MHATKAAAEEGIVPGGGAALSRTTEAVVSQTPERYQNRAMAAAAMY